MKRLYIGRIPFKWTPFSIVFRVRFMACHSQGKHKVKNAYYYPWAMNNSFSYFYMPRKKCFSHKTFLSQMSIKNNKVRLTFNKQYTPNLTSLLLINSDFPSCFFLPGFNPRPPVLGFSAFPLFIFDASGSNVTREMMEILLSLTLVPLSSSAAL